MQAGSGVLVFPAIMINDNQHLLLLGTDNAVALVSERRRPRMPEHLIATRWNWSDLEL